MKKVLKILCLKFAYLIILCKNINRNRVTSKQRERRKSLKTSDLDNPEILRFALYDN